MHEMFNDPLPFHHIPPKKPTFSPTSLPENIQKILHWECTSSNVGVSPSDIESFHAMFDYSWGENHVENPSRMAWILSEISPLLPNCLPIQSTPSHEFLHFIPEKMRRDLISLSTGNPPTNNTLAPFLHDRFDRNPKDFYSFLFRFLTTSCNTYVNLSHAIIQNDISYGFGITRPASHHSFTSAGTFCGINSVLVSTKLFISRGYSVLIVDWDVHRSFGTEDGVLDILKLQPLAVQMIDMYSAFANYPDNEGSTSIKSVFIDPYLGDDGYINALKTSLSELESYTTNSEHDAENHVCIVSCGFDACYGEKEGCRVSIQGFAQMTKIIKQKFRKILFCLEGGYEEETLGKCAYSVLQELIKE